MVKRKKLGCGRTFSEIWWITGEVVEYRKLTPPRYFFCIRDWPSHEHWLCRECAIKAGFIW
jgi:hypothetical protein